MTSRMQQFIISAYYINLSIILALYANTAKIYGVEFSANFATKSK